MSQVPASIAEMALDTVVTVDVKVLVPEVYAVVPDVYGMVLVRTLFVKPLM